MKNNTNLINIAVILSLVLLGVAARLLPHPWNFTPLSAIALAVSTYFGWRYSALAILSIMLLSDTLLGSYHWEIMLAVYGSFLLAAAMGTLINRKKPATMLLGSLGSSLLFFLITNWAVWQFGTMYVHNFAGLLESYTMALPFFKNSLTGDLVYTILIFSAFEFCLYLKPKLALARS